MKTKTSQPPLQVVKTRFHFFMTQKQWKTRKKNDLKKSKNPALFLLHF